MRTLTCFTPGRIRYKVRDLLVGTALVPPQPLVVFFELAQLLTRPAIAASCAARRGSGAQPAKAKPQSRPTAPCRSCFMCRTATPDQRKIQILFDQIAPQRLRKEVFLIARNPFSLEKHPLSGALDFDCLALADLEPGRLRRLHNSASDFTRNARSQTRCRDIHQNTTGPNRTMARLLGRATTTGSAGDGGDRPGDHNHARCGRDRRI